VTNPAQKPNSPLTANSLRATVSVRGYQRILHPITGRFVGEYDRQRNLLIVVDRGKTAIVDLNESEKP
jgi:hypothetical protein